MNIDWFEDDSGFVDCCVQGKVFFYDLQLQMSEMKRITDKDFSRRNTSINGVVNIPGMTNRALVVSAERKVFDSNDQINGCDTRLNVSQVQILANGKAFFCGMGETGHPGAVQIWKFPMEQLSEVQAHGAPIERMRLSYNNDWLFTAGRDCCLMIHEVKDKDPRGGLVRRDRDQGMLPFSDEILTEKSEMDDIHGERDRLINELAQARDPSHSGVAEKSSASE